MNKTDVRMFTSVHTNINSSRRISSMFRKYANENFTQWAWETFVWDGDAIIDEDTSSDIEGVMEKHKEFYEKYSFE